MISLDYPTANCVKFFIHSAIAFGPLDGNLSYQATTIPIDLDSNLFRQARGIYGENSVLHSVSSGYLEYFPIFADCVPTPSLDFPRWVSIPVSTGMVMCQRGFAANQAVFVEGLQALNYYTQYATVRKPSGWRLVKVDAYKSSPFKAWRCTVHDFVDFRWSNNQLKFTETVWQSTTTKDVASQNFSIPRSWEEIQAVIQKCTGWTSYSTTSVRDIYTTNPSLIKSPSVLAEDIAALMYTIARQNTAVPRKHFGDLAAQAVQGKRAVQVNMLAFLRDLKDVKSLIPKLKNLGKLKTWANNYLAVKYGILPTVDDLQKIVKAFNARKPFFDKNGYTMYNAKHLASVDDGSIAVSLEQRIKVAVADEDSDFDILLERLDSMGVLPTTENLWDLVRYSFVIDWFVDVGSLLERVDNRLRLMRYNIRYVTMSEKYAVSGVSTMSRAFPLNGSVSWRYYHRWVTDHCPLPPLTLTLSPTVADHWLEAAALIIQRGK